MVRVNVAPTSNSVPSIGVRTVASPVTTADPSYSSPLRPKVTIQSNDGSLTYFIYDSFLVDKGSFSNASFTSQSFTFGNESYNYRPGTFNSTSFTSTSFTQPTNSALFKRPLDQLATPPANPNIIRIISVTVDIGMNQAGSFEIQIEDSNRVIDRNVIGEGNKFIIEVGKDPTSYHPILEGYVRQVKTTRDDTGLLLYDFAGYGSQIVFQERIVDFQKQAARQSLGTIIPSLIDPNVTAFQMVKSLFEGFSGIPIRGLPSIQQQTGMTDFGVDSRVNTFIPAISQPLVTASQVMDTLANESGAVWGVQNGDLYFRYPTQVHSGVTIKDSQEANDPINKTGYIIGQWSFTDSIDLQDGYCNGLYLKGATLDPTADVQSTATGGSTALYNLDIAQQVIADSARLKNLALLLVKVGDGGSLNQQMVTGAIVHDKNGTPTGSKVMDLQIPISSIGVTPTAVFDFKAKFSVKDIQVGTPYWIILYAKGTSVDNTIRWLHDGNVDDPNHYSATRQVGLDPSTEDRTHSPLKDDSSGWIVSSTGPTYTHAFFRGVRALAYASDPKSRDKYGLIEAVHDVPWIQDNATLQIYAANVLQALSKPVRKFTLPQVMIPSGFVFLPGQLVSIVDNLSGLRPPQALDAEIQEVRYVFAAPSSGTAQNNSAPGNSPGAGGGTHALGTNYCEIMAITYKDFQTSAL